MSSVKYGVPHLAHLHNPVVFITAWLVGLAFLLAASFIIDKLGSAMFRRGFAKPFYLKGKRIHHKIIYIIIPLGYLAISELYLMGYIIFEWAHLWTTVGFLCIITAACIAVDFIGDRFWPEIRKNVILHHELVYTLIPVYLFVASQMFVFVI